MISLFTVNVPAIFVLPDPESIVNLLVLTSKLPSTPNVLLISTVLRLVFPVTPNVPAIFVFPVIPLTVNLLVLTSKLPIIVVLSFNVIVPELSDIVPPLIVIVSILKSGGTSKF